MRNHKRQSEMQVINVLCKNKHQILNIKRLHAGVHSQEIRPETQLDYSVLKLIYCPLC